ncbi:MAG: (Fe-S)-binding protein [Desulfobacteraceae bacterium]|nr:(Fe-S)-binding protein [Desulfobacteraceae bacterium]
MKTVSMFIPCTVDLFLPEIGEATYFLLKGLGVTPIYHEEQTCCGQPAINAGFVKHARDVAKHFIEVFESDEAIVCPSGSCVCTVKYRYPELLCDEPAWLDRAEAIAARTYELTQYIVDVLGVEDCGVSFDGKIAYHESCHVLRGLGVSEQPKKLISNVKGAEFVPMQFAEGCCGFGGEFAINYPDISEAMVQEKCENYMESGADLLLLCEPGCLLNIGGYLRRNHPDKKVMHMAQFLASNAQNRGMGKG